MYFLKKWLKCVQIYEKLDKVLMISLLIPFHFNHIFIVKSNFCKAFTWHSINNNKKSSMKCGY